MNETARVPREFWSTLGAILTGRARVWRVFWLGVVPPPVVLLVAVSASIPIPAPGWIGALVLLALIWAWLLWAPVVIWRSARASHPYVRYSCRFGAIAISGFIAYGILTPHVDNYTRRDKLQEAVTMSNPHRVALGIACSEGALKAGVADSHEVLGLGVPEEYTGNYVRSITATMTGSDGGRVEIVIKRISEKLEEGQTVVYEGRCENQVMCLQRVTGSVPKSYLEWMERSPSGSTWRC